MKSSCHLSELFVLILTPYTWIKIIWSQKPVICIHTHARAHAICLETLLHEGKLLDVGVILNHLIDVIRDYNVLEG